MLDIEAVVFTEGYDDYDRLENLADLYDALYDTDECIVNDCSGCAICAPGVNLLESAACGNPDPATCIGCGICLTGKVK